MAGVASLLGFDRGGGPFNPAGFGLGADVRGCGPVNPAGFGLATGVMLVSSGASLN